MAKPSKQSETKVTRISASDSPAPKRASKKPVETSADAETAERPARRIRRNNPFAALGRYIKGSWYELRQVRWPDRRATWGMTGALIAFTLFFVVFILLVDAGFSELLKLIMGK